jgi:NNP family nitrate/nitrite transporter-like MFS transporter
MGGRIVYTAIMLAAAVATYFLTWATTYCPGVSWLQRLFVGIAGGSFAVGIAYVSRWYPTEKTGHALGIFGVGNVGAAVTKFLAPFVLVALWWPAVAQVWACGHRHHGGAFLVSHRATIRSCRARRARGEKPRSAVARARGSQESPGLARSRSTISSFRRVRRAVAVAAAVSDQASTASTSRPPA